MTTAVQDGRDMQAVPQTARQARPRERDRWIDLLRALALVRVVTFHTFDWLWLPLAFPSMGIMFALGGRLVASSLDRVTTPRTFYAKRIRRLLPPLWVFGAVVVPVMLYLGWHVDQDQGSDQLGWSTGWLWLFPISDPPGSSAGINWVTPLWYIRTYLWLILLSPALLWLFRRWPLRVAAVPVVLMGLLVSGLLNLDGSRTYDILVELATFTCCWLAGFALHDGNLQRLPWRRTVLAGVALMAAGLWYAFSHQAVYGSYNPDDIPLSDMLYSLGAVVLLLRFSPRLTWLRRFPTLEAVVGLVNSRAMTIYLWNTIAIALAPLVLARTPFGRYDTADFRGQLVEYAVGWLLILVAIVVFGWVEDVAAARPPRLLPWQRATGRKGRPVVLEGNVVVDGADAAVPGVRGDGVAVPELLPRRPSGSGTATDVPAGPVAADPAAAAPPVADVVFEGNVAVEQRSGGRGEVDTSRAVS